MKKFDLKIPANLGWLRIVGAICVYYGHSKLHIMAGYGSIFFMVLAGYIFTRLFLGQMSQRSEINFGDFFYRRVKKIVPPVLGLLALGLAFDFYSGHVHSRMQMLSVLTFSANYFNAYNGHPNTGLSHLWTVSLIMQFYLLWSLALNHFYHRPEPTKVLNRVLGLTILAVMSYRSFLQIYQLSNDAYIFNTFETRADSMALGALLALNVDRPFFTRLTERLSSRVALSATIFVVWLLGFQQKNFRNMIGFDLQSLAVCLLFLALIGGEKRRATSFIDRLGIDRVAYGSYLFYVFHPWGLAIGDHLPLPDYGQVTVGGSILASIIWIGLGLPKWLSDQKEISES